MQEKAQLIIEQIPRLRRYARALTGDASLADDLVQDSLERAWSRFHLWRPGSNIRAWMFTIMHNCYANTVRRAKHRPRLVPLEEWGSDAQIGPSQEKAVELANVAAALRQLPDEQRAVVLLVGLEELTYAEAAKILGIPLGTVMSRLSRGRARLRNFRELYTVLPIEVVSIAPISRVTRFHKGNGHGTERTGQASPRRVVSPSTDADVS